MLLTNVLLMLKYLEIISEIFFSKCSLEALVVEQLMLCQSTYLKMYFHRFAIFQFSLHAEDSDSKYPV